MAMAGVRRTRSNLPRALLFAGALVAVFLAAGAISDRVGPVGTRVSFALIAATVVLAPVALVWVVGELHLRWSPRGRIARGVVGWTLVVACLGLLVTLAPVGVYLLVMSLGYAVGW